MCPLGNRVTTFRAEQWLSAGFNRHRGYNYMIYIKNYIVTKLTNNIVNLVTSFAKRVYIPVLRNKEWGGGYPMERNNMCSW